MTWTFRSADPDDVEAVLVLWATAAEDAHRPSDRAGGGRGLDHGFAHGAILAAALYSRPSYQLVRPFAPARVSETCTWSRCRRVFEHLFFDRQLDDR